MLLPNHHRGLRACDGVAGVGAAVVPRCPARMASVFSEGPGLPGTAPGHSSVSPFSRPGVWICPGGALSRCPCRPLPLRPRVLDRQVQGRDWHFLVRLGTWGAPRLHSVGGRAPGRRPVLRSALTCFAQSAACVTCNASRARLSARRPHPPGLWHGSSLLSCPRFVTQDPGSATWADDKHFLTGPVAATRAPSSSRLAPPRYPF